MATKEIKLEADGEVKPRLLQCLCQALSHLPPPDSQTPLAPSFTRHAPEPWAAAQASRDTVHPKQKPSHSPLQPSYLLLMYCEPRVWEEVGTPTGTGWPGTTWRSHWASLWQASGPHSLEWQAGLCGSLGFRQAGFDD